MFSPPVHCLPLFCPSIRRDTRGRRYNREGLIVFLYGSNTTLHTLPLSSSSERQLQSFWGYLLLVANLGMIQFGSVVFSSSHGFLEQSLSLSLSLCLFLWFRREITSSTLFTLGSGLATGVSLSLFFAPVIFLLSQTISILNS